MSGSRLYRIHPDQPPRRRTATKALAYLLVGFAVLVTLLVLVAMVVGLVAFIRWAA